jgi:hypothetical protein
MLDLDNDDLEDEGAACAGCLSNTGDDHSEERCTLADGWRTLAITDPENYDEISADCW